MKGSTWELVLATVLMSACAMVWQTGSGDADFIRQASAEDDSAQPTTLEGYCRSWARNGMMGVNVQRRGGPRVITYLSENDLRYLLKHQVAGDNLYLLHGEYTAAEKHYLEESLLAGYDRMGIKG